MDREPVTSEPKALAVRPDEVPAPRFEFRVSLTPEELLARFREDERIEWSEQPPQSFPRRKRVTFQGWLASARKVVIRHVVRNPKDGASPNVHIEWEADPRGGTLVRGRFLRRAVPIDLRPWLTGAVVTIAGSLAIFLLIGVPPIHYFIAGVLAAASLVAMSSSRPTRKSMEIFGAPLWQLVGETFVPHALGSGDHAPFRE